MRKTFVRPVAIFAAIIFITTPLLAQEAVNTQLQEETPQKQQSNSDTCIQGILDGKNDGKGSSGYFIAGLGCGILGFVFAASSSPSPEPIVLMTKSKTHSSEYMACYQQAYKDKGRKNNMTYAGIGWVIGAAVALAIIYSGSMDTSSGY